MIVTTTQGEMDDSALDRTDYRDEDDDRVVVAVEYCLKGCDGEAHTTGRPPVPGCFCPRHVHRSVAVTVKRFPEGECSGVLAQIG